MHAHTRTRAHAHTRTRTLTLTITSPPKGINGETLLQLTDNELKAAGVDKLGERKAVLAAAAQTSDPLFPIFLEHSSDGSFQLGPNELVDMMSCATNDGVREPLPIATAEVMVLGGKLNFRQLRSIMDADKTLRPRAWPTPAGLSLRFCLKLFAVYEVVGPYASLLRGVNILTLTFHE